MKTSDSDFVVFDLETTGLSPLTGARVIEIGAVKVERGKIGDEFHSLINQRISIPKAAQKIHGITVGMLQNHPGPRAVFLDFYRFIGDSLLVAHNAKFDLNFLRAELANLGLRLPNRSECTLQLSRKRYPDLPNYRLEIVARHLLGSIPKNLIRHRALNDARLTVLVLLEINKDE